MRRPVFLCTLLFEFSENDDFPHNDEFGEEDCEKRSRTL